MDKEKLSLQNKLLEKEQEVIHLQNRINAIHSSRSWRLTKALRFLTCVYYYLFKDRKSPLYFESRRKVKFFVISLRNSFSKNKFTSFLFNLPFFLTPNLKKKIHLMHINELDGSSVINATLRQEGVVELSENGSRVYHMLLERIEKK